MENLGLLFDILRESVRQFRKGEPVEELNEGGFHVVEVFAMPHVSEAPPDLEMVDVAFMMVGVEKAAAERRRADLIRWLERYPSDRLAEGPSYIEVGGVIGSQDAALCLFALGKVLGLWKLITPATLGFEGEEALKYAGAGLVMISGWRKPGEGAAA